MHSAQAVRYEVFYREMDARPNARDRLSGRDFDSWDAVCDHLLIVDEIAGREKVVGTCRLLRGSVAKARSCRFYTQSEFDMAPLVKRHTGLEFLELGRSCILEEWRNKRTVELLWHGIWSYAIRHRIDVMFGCASFRGADPVRHAPQLSFLHHFAVPEPDWDVRAVSDRAARWDLIEKASIDPKRVFASLPPLIKGYLRLGAWTGRDAVVDDQFNTTDVLIILPVARLNPRYVNYYGADAGRHSAPDE
jgi:putative hemolysin